MNEMQKQIEIENFINELFIAIEEHSLLKADTCIKNLTRAKIKKQFLNGEKYGINLISFAVQKDSLNTLRLLVKSGADVDAASRESLRVALHVAAECGREYAGQFLLNRGAEINFQDITGKTPLYLASFYCQVAMVELLINYNADISIKDIGGRTPIDVVGDDPKSICTSNTRQKIIFILECADKEVNCQTLASRTNLKVIEASNNPSYHSSTSVLSSAVKPSSFINSIFSEITTTISSLFSSAPALPPTQQFVAHSVVSPIGSSQVDCNGTVLLTAVTISKLTGKKYLRPLDDSLLTIEEIREKKVNTIKEKFDIAMGKFNQCPGSLLGSPIISKDIHQRSL